MLQSQTPKRILIAPLDWGLGHATRCIPIIRELQKQNAIVFIASSGNALLLLKDEFPELTFYEITPYQVHYSRSLPFMWSMFFQLPKFIRVIRKENKEIEKIVSQHNIDVIISDNRFGCFAQGITSVFITHQVTILMPPLLKWLAPIINHFNHQRIKKFDHCWVPDESTDGITGRLTIANNLNLKFIGMLSRFEKLKDSNEKYDLLVLLSGPEPDRTVMEEVIVKKLSGLKLKVIMVRGLPGKTTANLHLGNNTIVQNYLNATELNRVMEESKMIICRSGYSTIMDLARLNKKAIVIPTLGQTEQEYLAEQLSDKKIVFATTLNDLDILKSMEMANNFSGFNITTNNQLLSTAINELLA